MAPAACYMIRTIMFENLDQNKGQNSSAIPPAPAKPVMGGPAIPPASPKGPVSGSAPTPPKVEDMFASVKDAGSPATKTNGTPAMTPVKLPPANKASGNGLGVLVAVIIILVVIILGIFIAGRFLGVQVLSPASWESKISGLSGYFVKQPASQTAAANNEAPVTPAQPSNAAEQPSASSAPATPPADNFAVTPTSPAATSAPVIASSTVPHAPTSSVPAAVATSTAIVDRDADGLSDLEEAAVGTDPLKADTDGDGYSDKTELLNLFNPVGSGALSADPNIAEYLGSKPGYSVLYPKSFNIDYGINVTHTATSTMFEAPNLPALKIFIQITVEVNAAKEDILTWYAEKFPATPVKNTDIISQNGLQGIFSPDKNEFYGFDAAKDELFTVRYSSPDNSDKSYYNIFLMMVKSLKEINK
jgi:Bacterial TSP3 repeat